MSGVTGFDAAAGGWVAARITKAATWELDFIASPNDTKITQGEVYVPSMLVEYVTRNKLSLIDMPVGLVGAGQLTNGQLSPQLAMHRESAARRLLRERVVNGGRYVASVFSTPVQEAVYAERYEAASKLNMDALGKAISKQTWNLVYRIKQVQAVIRMVPGSIGTLLEAHPETVFRLLHANSDVCTDRLTSKRTQQGIDQRLRLLDASLPGAQAVFEEAWEDWGKGARVQRDDVVDAMVLALCAFCGLQDGKLLTPDVRDGSLREVELTLVDFAASKLGSGIHSRRRDVLAKAQIPEGVPRGAGDVPLCMVYCDPGCFKASR